MQSTLSTRDSSKIANYNQQSQKYLSFEDQLTLNFIANKLLSVEDLTQTLNKLKKIILMFKFRLESTYKMFRLEKVLEDSLNILYEITANIRYNFLGGKR
jgi:6-phosphogluconate dehydrogenase